MTEKYCPVPISVCEYGTGEKADCMNCDLNKRYSKKTIDNWETYIVDRETGKEYGYDVNTTINLLNDLHDENEELKQQIKSLEKQCHLIHMQSMFSTVKSFKGDVSKRYKYSEKTDTIYDTANHYGQYDKVLDKKEITMLLNEYETILKELEE